MRNCLVSLMVLLVVGISASTALAQWREIGSKEVDYNIDHDTMNITSMKGDFSAHPNWGQPSTCKIY